MLRGHIIMIKDIALLVGNGVNVASKGVSWKDLLNKIVKFCKCPELQTDENKPFPLFYEEIFLTAINNGSIKREVELKKFIAMEVSKIEPNPVHQMIRELRPAHVITLNYEFLLEGTKPAKNSGLVNEALYSVFRKYMVDGIIFWHPHGDCHNPISINLGYEHYGGQLQKMRNYVTAIPDYKTKKIAQEPLFQRLKNENGLKQIQSWIDLFFTTDIHIIGLTLDFVETDLWWLITYRARQQKYKQDFLVRNKIYYYTPKAYVVEDKKFKLKMLEASGVTVIPIDKVHGVEYYASIIGGLSNQ